MYCQLLGGEVGGGRVGGGLDEKRRGFSQRTCNDLLQVLDCVKRFTVNISFKSIIPMR